jgi:hypothetical protein
VIVALAMAGANIRAGTGRADMRTSTHAVAVQSAARADRGDMRPGMHAMVAHTGARSDDRPDMTTRGDAMLTHACARAGAKSVAARADSVLVHFHTRAHAQYIDAKINGTGGRCERHQQSHGANSGGKLFHSGNTSCGTHANAR